MTNMVVYGDKTANTLLFTVYNQNRRVKEDTEIHTFENESNLTRLVYEQLLKHYLTYSFSLLCTKYMDTKRGWVDCL